jgi:hypothetical protein
MTNPTRALLAIMQVIFVSKKKPACTYWLDHIGYFGPP